MQNVRCEEMLSVLAASPYVCLEFVAHRSKSRKLMFAKIRHGLTLSFPLLRVNPCLCVCIGKLALRLEDKCCECYPRGCPR